MKHVSVHLPLWVYGLHSCLQVPEPLIEIPVRVLCNAEDAFKEHYFRELQSLPNALSSPLKNILIFSKWTGRGTHWY